MATHPALQSGIDLFTAWLEARMAYAGLPGASVALLTDEAVLWARGFGFADAARQLPAAPDTLYRIASITKLFTATAVLQLRDAGRLQLDDPVARHLPWFTIRERFADEPPITLRHLLTHTAGLPRESAFPYWMTAEFPSLAEIQARLPQQETILPRDSKLKYSNLGLALAGEVVTAVSGMPYADYVHAHILAPLGMADTFVAPVPAEHPRLAAGYGRRLPDGTRAPSPYTDAAGLTPAFNMATTVQDLARFGSFMLQAADAGVHPVLHGRTRREMQRVHFLDANWTEGWGLGFSIFRRVGHTLVGHGGAVLGYRTGMMLNPAQKVGLIVFTNADDGDPTSIVMPGLRWLGEAVQRMRREPQAVETADPAWQAYVGKYRSAWGDSQVLVYHGRLVSIQPALPDPLPTMTMLRPAGAHTFRQEQPGSGLGQHGELLRFELNEAGRAVSMVDANGALSRRVAAW